MCGKQNNKKKPFTNSKKNKALKKKEKISTKSSYFTFSSYSYTLLMKTVEINSVIPDN